MPRQTACKAKWTFLCIDVTAGAKKCKILMELEIPRLIKTPEQAPAGCMLDTGDSK